MQNVSNPGVGLFDPAAVDPEVAKFNTKIEEELAAIPPLYTIDPKVIRTAREAGDSIWGPIKRLPEVGDRTIPTTGGGLRLRVFVPDDVNGIYLHIHGGGFMLGAADHHDELLMEVGRTCKVAVVSVDYRLAPEAPYPAGPDDCEAAALWLAENGASEFGSGKIVIGGESAGGNLSAVTLLRMRDRHGFTGFRGAVLNYGVYDLALTPSARNWGERNLVLTTKLMSWFHHSYAPDENHADPDLSPLYADLADMPPALFTIGTLDPLLDDSMFMHSRWLAAGNRSELAIYPGGVHAFNAFPTKLAEKANARILEFIAESVLHDE